MEGESGDWARLRALYAALVLRRERFEEFAELLDRYEVRDAGDESVEASAVRACLDRRFREWLGGDFDGFTVTEIVQWRRIVVDGGRGDRAELGLRADRRGHPVS